ncbi:MAG: rlmI [Chlamydiia bacterium]|nr:rlmI [Chlamydiia bacterium]
MKVLLKPGREKSVLAKHPWIFSGAIQELSKCDNGDVLPVYSSKGLFLGSAMISQRSQIVCRMLTFDETPHEEALRRYLKEAIYLRKQLFTDSKTTAYRIINAEGDFIPGLIVDRYADTLVIQISSIGIHRLKQLILDELIEAFKPTWIYEKSTAPSRKEEGLAPFEGTIYGTPLDTVEIMEEGLLFTVSPKTGQKTGFFLDQREMRVLVRDLAKGKKVLNCFSYTGAFSVYALAGGALSVDSIDISKDAVANATKHIQMNGFQDKEHTEYAEDVFEYLKNTPKAYDLVILDPPAFAKKKSDIMQAARGYKEINMQAMKMMPKNSYLLTCSCSYYVDETLFRQILFQAALDAKRDVRIIQRHRLAEDHPLNVYHPEGSYLKSFLCYIS